MLPLGVTPSCPWACYPHPTLFLFSILFFVICLTFRSFLFYEPMILFFTQSRERNALTCSSVFCYFMSPLTRPKRMVHSFNSTQEFLLILNVLQGILLENILYSHHSALRNHEHVEFNLALPKPNTNFCKKSFSYRGTVTWNDLLPNVKNMGSLSTFKRALVINDGNFSWYLLFSFFLSNCSYCISLILFLLYTFGCYYQQITRPVERSLLVNILVIVLVKVDWLISHSEINKRPFIMQNSAVKTWPTLYLACNVHHHT